MILCCFEYLSVFGARVVFACFVFFGREVRFDSSAKLAGWPFGGAPSLWRSFSLFCCLFLSFMAFEHCTSLLGPPKYKKNLPDAGGTVIKEAVLSR